MTFDDTTFEPATPKGAKPKGKSKIVQATEPDTDAAGMPIAPKQRRRRVARGNTNEDLKQVISFLKGIPKARRKIIIDTVSMLFED